MTVLKQQSNGRIDRIIQLYLVYHKKIGICESLRSANLGSVRKARSEALGVAKQIKINRKILARYTYSYQGWFKGLSHTFLNIHIPKVLLTAEKERMDKELTIAQMQGKFKVVIIHNVGHSVQEDDCRSTARELYNLLKDFRIPTTLSEKAEKELVGIANFHPNLIKY